MHRIEAKIMRAHQKFSDLEGFFFSTHLDSTTPLTTFLHGCIVKVFGTPRGEYDIVQGVIV